MTLHSAAQSAEEVLAAFGGFEIVMMTGAYLEAARRKMLIIVDGFITTSALLAASHIAPSVLDYCVYSHLSHEAGHRAVLQHLNADPLLQLDLRLGEGTGAALAYPLVVAAAAFLNDMASFASAGVSEKST
jgi:nicotinate-nucleotide--dimethylbenzimidazole phosphoribosyltransferase